VRRLRDEKLVGGNHSPDSVRGRSGALSVEPFDAVKRRCRPLKVRAPVESTG
jgi:hypothetical protein